MPGVGLKLSSAESALPQQRPRGKFPEHQYHKRKPIPQPTPRLGLPDTHGKQGLGTEQKATAVGVQGEAKVRCLAWVHEGETAGNTQAIRTTYFPETLLTTEFLG